MRTLLIRAGVDQLDRGSVPIPTALQGASPRWLGLEPRMPFGEFSAVCIEFPTTSSTCRSRNSPRLPPRSGIRAIVLALDDVLDNGEPEDVPNREAIEAAGLPIFDLFDVYPSSERASLRVAPWDNHPNKRGHELIADRLYAELVRTCSRAISAARGLESTPSPEARH